MKCFISYTTVAVDNISELERCILSDLGAQGKNKGVPAQADYQYMQFKLVNSLRLMKTLGVNVVWTAWQDVRNIVNIDGTQYTQLIPKINQRIVDNICGLCDVVGKIIINKEGRHGILLAATVRARRSSLKHHKSSMLPPPRVTTMTSQAFVLLKNSTPRATCAGACSP